MNLRKDSTPRTAPPRGGLRSVRRLLFPVLIASSFARAESVSDFTRFQIILERKPFGNRTESAAGETAGAGPQAGSLRISAMVEGADGVRVGLIDLQGNGSLFLKVGESENGIQLVSVDLQTEEAVVRRGGESIVLRLESGVSRSPEAAFIARPVQAVTQKMPADPGAQLKLRREVAMARIQARRDAAVAAQGAPSSNLIQKVAGPELERKLQEYQMEVIRRGDPPLPIPLTKEMDDQLVSEGVLPVQ